MRGRLLVPLAVLWGLLRSPQASQSERTWWCSPSGACYNVYLRRLNHSRAQEACAVHGGTLSTASGSAEVEAILALLRGVANAPGRRGGGSPTALFWLGLVRKAQQCTMEELPLRGFSWASPDRQQPSVGNESAAAETPSWVREPSKSCVVQKCAGLQVTWGEPRLEPWGLREQACTKESPGYLCKYSYEGSCPPVPHSPKARNLHYTLPFRLQSATVEFSPPGTMLTLRCPGGREEARFTCRLSPDGFHWEGTERGLCSCPSGYWSRGHCVEPEECRGVDGAFRCLCAWDARLGLDERSCVPPSGLGGDLAASANSTLLPTPPLNLAFPSNCTAAENKSSLAVEVGNASSPEADKPAVVLDSSNYAFILITVAVVMLVILVMAALQAFQVCFKSCSSKGAQPSKNGTTATVQAEGDPEVSATCTDSEHSLGPNKSAEASQDDLQQVAGQAEFEQP